MSNEIGPHSTRLLIWLRRVTGNAAATLPGEVVQIIRIRTVLPLPLVP